MVSVAYEPWSTDKGELEDFSRELGRWGAETKLGTQRYHQSFD